MPTSACEHPSASATSLMMSAPATMGAATTRSLVCTSAIVASRITVARRWPGTDFARLHEPTDSTNATLGFGTRGGGTALATPGASGGGTICVSTTSPGTGTAPTRAASMKHRRARSPAFATTTRTQKRPKTPAGRFARGRSAGGASPSGLVVVVGPRKESGDPPPDVLELAAATVVPMRTGPVPGEASSDPGTGAHRTLLGRTPVSSSIDAVCASAADAASVAASDAVDVPCADPSATGASASGGDLRAEAGGGGLPVAAAIADTSAWRSAAAGSHGRCWYVKNGRPEAPPWNPAGWNTCGSANVGPEDGSPIAGSAGARERTHGGSYEYTCAAKTTPLGQRGSRSQYTSVKKWRLKGSRAENPAAGSSGRGDGGSATRLLLAVPSSLTMLSFIASSGGRLTVTVAAGRTPHFSSVDAVGSRLPMESSKSWLLPVSEAATSAAAGTAAGTSSAFGRPMVAAISSGMSGIGPSQMRAFAMSTVSFSMSDKGPFARRAAMPRTMCSGESKTSMETNSRTAAVRRSEGGTTAAATYRSPGCGGCRRCSTKRMSPGMPTPGTSRNTFTRQQQSSNRFSVSSENAWAASRDRSLDIAAENDSKRSVGGTHTQ
mmetsp:Transcript_17938/g.55718  ORF Transcript_17938/g.55718 Transcript_17938/m.55718 type:complete len:608 (-) Transcript_17938:18-1841(-)